MNIIKKYPTTKSSLFLSLSVVIFLFTIFTFPALADTLWSGIVGGDIYNANSGDVGIDTSSPARDLDLSSSGEITFGDDVTNNATQGLYWHSASNYAIFRESGTWSSPFPTLNIKWSTGVDYWVNDTSNYEHAFYYGSNKKLSIGDELLVIGTGELGFNDEGENISSPSYGLLSLESRGSLQFFANANSTATPTEDDGNLLFYTNDDYAGDPTLLMKLQRDGKVGIGTSSPTQILTVKGGDIDLRETDGGNSAIYLDATDQIGDLGVYKSGDKTIRLYGGIGAATYFDGGNVGIGTRSPTHTLTVDGTIKAEELIIESGIADYVFDDDYEMLSLGDVEKFIEVYGHLPGMPSQAEVEKGGFPVGEVNVKLLEKIEELTLHVIELEKRVEQLENNQ